MIAPIRSPKEILEAESSPRSRTRRLAAIFLREELPAQGAEVKAWKAWLVVAWMTIVAGVYFCYMLIG